MAAYAFTIDRLHELAPPEQFERGQKYYHDGRVRRLRAEFGRISAVVNGQHGYLVRLFWEGGAPSGTCTCPFHGQDTVWCEHVVAVAVAWLEQDQEGPTQLSPSPATQFDASELSDFLNDEEPTWLAEQLLRVAEEDPVVWVRLAAAAGSEAAVPAASDLIQEAILDYSPDVESWDHNTVDGAHRLERAIGVLEDLLDYGFADQVETLADDAAQLHSETQGDVADEHVNRLHELVDAANKLSQQQS